MSIREEAIKDYNKFVSNHDAKSWHFWKRAYDLAFNKAIDKMKNDLLIFLNHNDNSGDLHMYLKTYKNRLN